MVDGLGDKGVDAPLKGAGHDGTGDAQHHPFHYKGPADEGVGGAHHLHDGNFLLPPRHGHFDGVGDDEEGDHQEDAEQDDGDAHGHIADGDEAVGHIQGCRDLDHPLHLLHLCDGGGQLGDIGDL